MVADLPIGYVLGITAWCIVLVVWFVFGLKLRRKWIGQPERLRLVHGALSGCVLLTALTAVELFFAMFFDESDSLNMTNISRRWTARHVKFNPEGFRDVRPFERTLPAGWRRVVFLGDSFTFGQGIADVADRFSDRVGRDLDRARPGEFTVANLGVQGTGTAQQAEMIEKALNRQFQVDILVYVVCLNDIDNFYPDITQLYERMEPRRPTFFLFSDTYFFNLLYIHAQQFTIPELRMYGGLLTRWYDGPEWDRMAQSLTGLHRLCLERKVDLRIAVFPMVDNAGPAYPFRHAHAKIVNLCKELGVRVLDLEPAISRHANEGLRANIFDIHPSIRAHEIAAKAMERELLDDLFNHDRK